jgi:branched-chain amino acid transport system permease protein
MNEHAMSSKIIPAALFAILVLLGLIPIFAIGSGTEFSADILIYAIMALGLYVQLSLLGLVNFGFSAFFGVGGYLGAIFIMTTTRDLFLSLGLTMLICGLMAFLFGIVALRTRQTAFTMITLAFAQLLYVISLADDRWTGGVNGLTGVPRPRLPAAWREMGLTVNSDAGFYYLVLVLFLMTFAGIWILQRSRMGSVFAGIRENEERMTVLGFPVFSYKLTGFVISGVIGGYAGYLNALLFGFAGPGALFWTTSGEALLMVILGGTTSLAGPVIGAAVFIGISHYAVSYTDHWRLFVGIAFITIVMFAPLGIVSIVKSRFHAWRQLKTPDNSSLTK